MAEPCPPPLRAGVASLLIPTPTLPQASREAHFPSVELLRGAVVATVAERAAAGHEDSKRGDRADGSEEAQDLSNKRVAIVAGKYKGRVGVVERLTKVKAYVRLQSGGTVCIRQSSIRRQRAPSDAKDDAKEDALTSEGDAHILLNLLYAPRRSRLHSMAETLSRIEDLSHILAWSKWPPQESAEQQRGAATPPFVAPPFGGGCAVGCPNIDLVELPRPGHFCTYMSQRRRQRDKENPPITTTTLCGGNAERVLEQSVSFHALPPEG